ncbi:hypothetical protein ABKV19_014024 [Rosa sericea]
MLPEFSNEILSICDCPKLIDFPGLVDCVEAGQLISIEGHFNNIPSPLKRAILEEWPTIHGSGISFPGNRIPSWCSPHVNYRGRQVTFEMPFGRNIIELCVCFVYSRSPGEFDYDASGNGFLVVNHTRRTGFFIHQEDFRTTKSHKRYLFLRNMSLQDRLNFKVGDSISLRVVLGDYFKVHQIGVKLQRQDGFIDFVTKMESIPFGVVLDSLRDDDTGDEDHMPFNCFGEALDFLRDDDTDDEDYMPFNFFGEALDFLRDDDAADEDHMTFNFFGEALDFFRDDDTGDNVDEVRASYIPFDADNGTVSDYGEDDEGGARRDPLDEDRPTKRLRRFDLSIVTTSKDEQVAAEHVPSLENTCTFDEIRMKKGPHLRHHVLISTRLRVRPHLREDQKMSAKSPSVWELRRQLILSQQPNQIVVQRNFLKQFLRAEAQMTTQGPDDF